MARALTIADAEVLDATRRAIGQLHAMGIFYADVFAPLHDDALVAAMRRLTIRVRAEPLGPDAAEAVAAPFLGRYPLLYSSDLDDARRHFALRHGMGHVVAGHVSDDHPLRTRDDADTHEERVADLFALADLAPFWLVEQLRRGGWRATTQALCRTIRRHTIAWPDDRVLDRAALRVALYRDHGV